MVNTGVWTPFAQWIRTVRLLKETHRGFRLSSRRLANVVLSQTLLLRKKTIFWAIWWKQHIKSDLNCWWKCPCGGTNVCELLCMGLFGLCVWKWIFKGLILVISKLSNAKNRGFTNQGLWILYNHIPANWHFWAVTCLFTFILYCISLACCCSRLFVLSEPYISLC